MNINTQEVKSYILNLRYLSVLLTFKNKALKREFGVIGRNKTQVPEKLKETKK